MNTTNKCVLKQLEYLATCQKVIIIYNPLMYDRKEDGEKEMSTPTGLEPVRANPKDF